MITSAQALARHLCGLKGKPSKPALYVQKSRKGLFGPTLQDGPKVVVDSYHKVSTGIFQEAANRARSRLCLHRYVNDNGVVIIVVVTV
jgi:hypothetical protein